MKIFRKERPLLFCRRLLAGAGTSAFLLCAAPSYASFEQQLGGARSMAMGGAFTGLADAAEAVYYNAAGLGGLRRGEFFGSYARLYPGLSDNSTLSNGTLAGAYPLWGGALGGGLNIYSLQGSYRETTLGLFYGRKISSRWAAGGGVKYLSVDYGKDEYSSLNSIFAGGTGTSGIALDAGILFFPFPKWSFGLALRDANNPDLGLKYENTVSRSLAFGTAFRDSGFTLTGDFVLQGEDYKAVLGGEKWFMGRHFALRGGFGTGSRSYTRLSTGIGYDAGSIVVDYSFFYPLSGMSTTDGAHKVSFGYRFGETARGAEHAVNNGAPAAPPAVNPVTTVTPAPAPASAAPVAVVDSPDDEQVIVIDKIPDNNRSAGPLSTAEEARKAAEAARSLVQKGQYRSAQTKIREAANLNPKNASYNELKERLTFITGYGKDVRGDSRTERALRRGLARYYKDGPTQGAVEALMYAVSLQPENAAAEKLARAAAAAGRISVNEPVTSWNPVDRKLSRAGNLYSAKQYGECITLCDEVLSLDPENYLAYERLGTAYYALGSFDKAQQNWERALKYKPRDAVDALPSPGK